MKTIQHLFLYPFLALIALTSSIEAAEGAMGLYILGSQGPQAGVLPPPGTYLRNDFYHYNGRIGRSVLGGVASFGVKTNIFLDMLYLTHVTSYEILGGNLGMSAIIPYGSVGVRAHLDVLRLDFRRHSKKVGIADTMFTPFLLGWHFDDFHLMTYFAFYAPTGSFKRGRLANLGKNHWAFEPGYSFTWENKECGLEFSSWNGVTFNAPNHKIHYKTGDEFHNECYLGLTLGEGFQVGAASYYYKQLTRDQGRGAILGPFKGEDFGIGPVLKYDFKWGIVPISVNARYYKETYAKRHLKGDSFFVTFEMPLHVKGVQG